MLNWVSSNGFKSNFVQNNDECVKASLTYNYFHIPSAAVRAAAMMGVVILGW